MSKLVGACLRSQYGFVKTGKSEKALYLCNLMRALHQESVSATHGNMHTRRQSDLLSFTMDMHLSARAAVASGSAVWVVISCVFPRAKVTRPSIRVWRSCICWIGAACASGFFTKRFISITNCVADRMACCDSMKRGQTWEATLAGYYRYVLIWELASESSAICGYGVVNLGSLGRRVGG